VGVGYREDDYVATGYDFHERGRRLDAQLETMTRIWAGERVRPDGAPAGVLIGPIGPPPLTPGGPKLMVGGHVPAVARRVAKYGLGYLATVGGDEEDQAKMLRLWALVQEAWGAAGRTGRPKLVTGAYFALGPTADADADAYILTQYQFRPDVAARMRRGVPTSPQALRDVIRRQEEIGADEFILMACVEDLRTIEALLEVVGSR
jgi:alkanesulfonate monooxygenase SsuD/methylene tetrahydromethanopterin reductase-like flavin-dependent oxidoreductase (luciferase family)